MSIPEFILLRPWWLLALIPAGLLLWRLGRAPGAGESAWGRVVDPHLAPYVLAGTPCSGRTTGLAPAAAAFILAILALAGPGLGQPGEGAYRRDLTRIVVVELSSAMAAADGPSSRLERAKLKILDLLRALPAGQTALLVYGGEPYLVVPPSTDPETVARFVPELAADVIPVAGNRADLALQMAGRVLARSGSRAREILWITAGPGGAEVPVGTLAGIRLSILHAAPGRDGGLAALADGSGGVYTPMTAGDGDVRSLALSSAGGGWIRDSRAAGEKTDLGPWVLLVLLPLAALAFRRGLLAVFIAPLLLGGLLASPQAEARDLSPAGLLSDYLAWQRLKGGDAEGAAEGFADRRWRAAASYRAGRFEQAAAVLEGLRDADSLYNRGNALARQGRLTEALAAYEESLKVREDADARHNRDLVEKLLKQGGGSGQGSGGKPPPGPAPGQGPDSPENAEAEASRLAGRWLRQVPDDPGSLLRRKLQAEHRRRQAGEGARPW